MKSRIHAAKVHFRENLAKLKSEFPAPAQRTPEERNSFKVRRKELVDERDEMLKEIRQEFVGNITNPRNKIKVEFRQKVCDFTCFSILTPVLACRVEKRVCPRGCFPPE